MKTAFKRAAHTLGVTVLITGACFAALRLLYFQPYRLYYNNTQSMPIGWYLSKRSELNAINPKQEDILTYRPLIPYWAENIIPWSSKSTFIKKVGAIPGEYLYSRPEGIYACPVKIAFPEQDPLRCRFLGAVISKTQKGDPIPLQELPRWEAYRIPEGYYYMYSDRVPNSFDSRYQGLIPKHRLLGYATPLHHP